MKRNPKATCGTCPFWKASNEESPFGSCRAKLPVFHSSVARDPVFADEGTWPSTEADDWCGQHPDFDLDAAIKGNPPFQFYPIEKFINPPEYEQEYLGLTPSSLRRLRERNAKRRGGPTLSWTQWEALVEEFGGHCVRCGARSANLERDHIVPIYKGGCDCIHNIQPLCPKCNCQKGPETINWKERRRTHGFSETGATQ